ncbi:MAG: HEAT repeat domain-containing protein [Deltaproteobacteria bacterium]|nr:HEAT repeat domain-containing protein [Deltaproteobacteria bacterium]
MLRRILLLLLPMTLVFATVAGPAAARGKKKKKLSLAQLAALEWKLEQASNILAQNATPSARLKALKELGAIDDFRVIKSLAMALREDPAAKVRRMAATLLAKHRTPEVKGLLLLTSQADPDAALRAQAKKAFKSFPRRMKLAKLPLEGKPFKATGKVDAAAVKKALALPSGMARQWAIEKLGADKSIGGRVALLKTHLTHDPSPRVRIRSAQILGGLGKAHLGTLIQAMSDGDSRVRFEIARVLAGFDDRGVLLVLQKLAASDAAPEVRDEVSDLLEPSTKIGRRLLRDRIKMLRSKNPATRIAALIELAKFTEWRAMVPMACTLLCDKSVLVRAKAAEVLTHMHDTSVLTALRAAAVTEPDAKLKKRVRKLMAGLAAKVKKLIAQLKGGDEKARAKAARLLGQAAYPQAVTPLVSALKDKSVRVRLAVARALMNYGKKKAKAALKTAAADPNKKVQRAVAHFLKNEASFKGWRKFYRDTNKMVAKTFDKSPVWRVDAAIALGVAGAERAAINLIQLLQKDKSEDVRLAAAWSLVLMGTDAAEKALKKAAAKDKSERVRLTARKYLVISKVSVDDLRGQLQDASAANRVDAAEALSLRVSGRALYDLVKAAMCDSSPRVRAASLRGLARIGKPLAKTVLRTTMRRDDDAKVRRSALVMYILAGGK